LEALVVLFAVSCGGAAANESAPRAANEASSSEREDATDSEPESEAPAPKPAVCEDGTCSPCGSGLCPTGWYCDETAPGGAACSWLPACTKKSSCACLTAKLGSSCSCREQSGGLHVSCQ
jgi:hypothetical protein